MAKNRRGICAYCSKEKNVTRDHVPPKVLLAEPYPPHLLTVPACYDCNRAFQQDDDYTRNVLALDLRAQQNQSAKAKLPTVFRSLQRPAAAKFRDSFLSGMSPSSLVDASGQPLGSVFTPDVARVEATGKHIARGLHFSFCGQPLPLGYKLFVHSKPGYDSIDFFVPQFTSFYEKCSAHRQGYVGDVFSYVAVGLDSAQARPRLRLQYDRAEEMRRRRVPVRPDFRLVRDVGPERLPLFLAAPNVRSLVKRNAVLTAVLENLLYVAGVRSHGFFSPRPSSSL